MKLHEFIDQEFKKIAANELNQLFDEQQSKSLFVKIDDIFLGEDFNNLEKLSDLIKKDKNLRKLKSTQFILDQLIKIDDFEFSLNDLKLIKKQMKYEPNNRLLPLFWVYQQLDVFKEEEFFETELSEFFRELFVKFDYLVELEDFFYETNIAFETLHHERLKNSSELLYPLFRDAVNMYPDNFYLKKVLGMLCYNKGDFNESLTILNSINEAFGPLSELEQNDLISDLGFDYLELMQYMALNYDKLGNYEKVSECVEYVLANLPIVYTIEGKDDVDTFSYLDSFFLQMRLNMKKENALKVLDNYNRIEDNLEFYDWASVYPDVIKYVEDNK